MNELVIVFLLWMITVGLFILQKKFHAHLDEKWRLNPDLKINVDGKKHLSLTRVNGVGCTFYGRYRNLHVNGYDTYATYYVFSLFFIPVLPLGCCRVIKEEGGYRILGGESMAWIEILCMFIGMMKWIVGIVAFLRLLVLVISKL